MKFKEFKKKYKNEVGFKSVLDFLIKNGYENKEIMFNFEQAVLKEQEWIKRLNKNTNESIGQIKIIKDFGDGFKIVQLLDQEARGFEGKKMNHCVASYSDKAVIYSLRYELNEPHCTMELTGKSINQIKGYGNGKVSPKYIEYVLLFLKELNLNVDYYDMNNIGYYHLNSKIKVSFKKIFKDYKILKFNNKEYVYTGNQLSLRKPIVKFNNEIFYYLVQNDQCRDAFDQLVKYNKDGLNKSSVSSVSFDPIRVAAESENIYALDLILKTQTFNYYEQLKGLFRELMSDLIELNSVKSIDYFLSNDTYSCNRYNLFSFAIGFCSIIPIFDVLDKHYSLNQKELNELLKIALNDQSNKDIVTWLVNKGARINKIPVSNYFFTNYSKFNESIWVLINLELLDRSIRSNLYVLLSLGICYNDKKLIDLAVDSGFIVNKQEREELTQRMQLAVDKNEFNKYNELFDYYLKRINKDCK